MIARKLICAIQRFMLKLLLGIIYFLLFPVTILFLLIFNPGFFAFGRRRKITFWKEASGYSPGIKECLRQS